LRRTKAGDAASRIYCGNIAPPSGGRSYFLPVILRRFTSHSVPRAGVCLADEVQVDLGAWALTSGDLKHKE